MCAMPKQKVIIDCDPGQDDAINLLLALASPDELEVLGITTVAGNVPLDLTQRNARLMCDVAGRNDVKVYAGCSRPLVRDLVTAEHVHGRTGIDGMALRQPQLGLQLQHAVDFIVDTLMAAAPESITLVPTGPLTNIAMAFVKEPAVLTKVNTIVLMGGAMREGGNFTPSAEFNILVDPHAAHVVFQCGRSLTAFGLDVTHQVLASRTRIERIRNLGNPAATATADMLDFFNRHHTAKYGSVGAPLHDPCTIAYLLEPDLFRGKRCNVTVEMGSELTMGCTTVDFWHVTERPKNTNWIHAVNAGGFFDLLVERLARFSVA